MRKIQKELILIELEQTKKKRKCKKKVSKSPLVKLKNNVNDTILNFKRPPFMIQMEIHRDLATHLAPMDVFCIKNEEENNYEKI